MFMVKCLILLLYLLEILLASQERESCEAGHMYVLIVTNLMSLLFLHGILLASGGRITGSTKRRE